MNKISTGCQPSSGKTANKNIKEKHGKKKTNGAENAQEMAA